MNSKLEVIASLVTTKSIIDVGCDHGYLDIYLTKKGIKCLATDISDKAIKCAINNFKKNNLDIDYIVTDGLNNIDIKKSDTIIISGMGTDTIINILNKKITNDLIISSNNHLEKLRRYIVSMNYYIDKEIFIIENNKPYVIIKFKYGKKDYSDYDYILGINYDKNYLDYIKNKYINILNKIPDKYKEKKNYYNNLISEIERRYNVK